MCVLQSETEGVDRPCASRRFERVAIVHDWMFSRRGGEKVLERLLDLFPQSDLYVLFGEPEKVLRTRGIHRIKKSFLNRLPGIHRFYKHLLPLFPLATESHDLSGYDLVISSSSCAAKGVIPPPHALHIAYIHSPMRYAWDMERTYFPRPLQLRNPLAFLRGLFLSYLRVWDVTSAARVDLFLSNSRFVQRRIELYYGRPAEILHPPVHVEAFLSIAARRRERQNTVLLFGTWTPYKKLEVALEALVSKGFRVVAAGHGEGFDVSRNRYSTDDAERKHARADVTFVKAPSDEELCRLYEQAHVLVFPGVEDFGIIAVEAMASGLWVVGPDRGGTAETIRAGLTGFHFEPQKWHQMTDAVSRALESEPPGRTAEWEAHIRSFSEERFERDFMKRLQELQVSGRPDSGSSFSTDLQINALTENGQ